MHLWRAERDRALARRHARAPRGAEDPQVRQARCLAQTNILVHRCAWQMARTYYGTFYLGADGRWNGANSPIGP